MNNSKFTFHPHKKLPKIGRLVETSYPHRNLRKNMHKFELKNPINTIVGTFSKKHPQC